MKLNTRTKAFLLGAAVLGTIVLTGATARATTTYVQTINELNSGATNDWYFAIWSSGASATSGNDYLTAAIAGTNCGIRTPNVTTNFAFGGDHLILTNLGSLAMKHASATATANIILDGGQIIFRGSGGSGASGLAGTLQVNPNPNTVGRTGSDSGVNFYNLGQDQTGANARNILLSANLSGGGNLIVNMLTAAGENGNNVVQITGTNTAFSGNWTNNNGTLSLEGPCVDPLGTNNVVVVNSTDSMLRFNTTNDLVISNAIFGIGRVVKTNSNTVTLASTNVLYTGSTTISGGVLKIGAGSSLANSSLISLAGGTLDASAIGGLVLTLASNQQMNCNGSITGNLAASSDSTHTNNLNFALTPSANDTLNISGSLILTNNPMLVLTLAGIKAGGTYRIINYTNTSNIQGGGSFTLVPPVGSSQGFALDTSSNGQVNLIVSNAVVHNLTWVGDGSADSWDTTTADWTGDTNKFSEGDNVTFNDSSANTTIDVSSSSLYPSSMTVSNTVQSYTFYDFGISTSGSLTKRGSNILVLVNTGGNGFNGPIDIESGILSVGDGSSLGGNLGTGPITNNGVLQVNMSAPAAAFNSQISGSGSLDIMGSGAIATIGGNGHNTYTGLTTIESGAQLNIATSNALGSASTGTIVQDGGRLGVVSSVGLMTIAEPLTVSGLGVSPNVGALYVSDPANNVTWSGPITLAGTGPTQLRGVNNSRQNYSNAVLGTNVALTASAGNPAVIGGSDASTTIFFQSILSLGSGGSLTMDGPGTVVLDGGTNVWGNGTVVNLGTLRVDGTLNGGTVTVGDGTDFATLAGTGTILGSVTVASGSLMFPGSFTTPIGTLTVSNSVTFSGGSTNLFELDRSLSPNSDRVVANSISYNGTLTVVNTGVPLQAGDTFTLFSVSGSKTGSFAVTNLPALSSTNLFWITTNLNNGIITVGGIIPTPTPFTNSSVRIVGTNVIFNMGPSGSGLPYVVQATTNLNPPVTWVNIQTNTGTGGTISVTNPMPSGTPRQFFRTVGP